MKLLIRVKPGSKKSDIKKDVEHWNIWTTRRAIGGEANSEIIKILAKEFGVAQSKIRIEKGMKSKIKTIVVEDFD